MKELIIDETFLFHSTHCLHSRNEVKSTVATIHARVLNGTIQAKLSTLTKIKRTNSNTSIFHSISGIP